jgi:2-polyprenyl-6-methoxyphenol hydroxylase-like FAD-dependent oxidoreductase
MDTHGRRNPHGEIAVLGSGPAGMAAALALLKAGHAVTVYERYKEARPAGNILNLWPPPLKALRDMGVDIEKLGAPCHTTFRNAKGYVRAEVRLPEHVEREYGGGFIGLLRPDLYKRMLSSIPEGTIHFGRSVTHIESEADLVRLHFSDGETKEVDVLIGADGIDSSVRKHLWGDSPKRPHNLHVIGGFTFDDISGAEKGEVVLSHSQTIQGTYSSILSEGRQGYQWWMLEAWADEKSGPENLHEHAKHLAIGFRPELQEMICRTREQDLQRWPIRDRRPLTRWSKGRATLAGDAAHPTSPYAAYGAGMSICDGYFLGQCLAGVNLRDTNAVEDALEIYESKRIKHTTDQVEAAYKLGQMFHHMPVLLRPIRDIILDNTWLLQKQVGEKNPAEIVAQLEEMGPGIIV